MIRKLVVVHPHLNVRGGSERLTKILVEELIDMGVDVHVVTGSVDPEWFRNSVKVYPLNRAADPKDVVVEVVRSCDPDAVFVAISESYYAYAAKEAKKSVVVGMYIHFPLDEEISEKNVEEYRSMFRFPQLAPKYLNSVDVFMVNSRRTALAVEFLWGLKPEVVYPCIDRVFFEEEPELGKPRENVILYVGRFTPLKRQDFLVLALKQIREAVPDARLVLAGYVDPRHREYFEHVKEIAEEVEGVELVPTPSEKKLLELYREAKVYAHPRIGEHFGMAPIEAMSQGTPIVVRSPTGLEEVVENGVEGYVAYSDYDMVRAIVKILRMPHSEWVEMQKRAYRRAQDFKPRNYAERVLKTLERALH